MASLGRLERLRDGGGLDRLLRSAARFTEGTLALVADGATARTGDAEDGFDTRRIGPALIFERLWRESGCRDAVRERLAGRRFEFPVERAMFFSVPHRLMASGSDRSAIAWRRDQVVEGADELQLQHLYRTMAWLGELTPGAKEDLDVRRRRCVKDEIEEDLFDRRRDLFSDLDIVYFDTTSLFFHGEGGATLGRRGRSKDRRPDCKQIVVGLALDGEGAPVCSEIWPGNAADVKALEPVAERLSERFGVRSVCLVADRGMISARTIDAIEARGWNFILGARPRSSKEIRDKVLTDDAPWSTIHVPRLHDREPLELRVKEVRVAETPEASDGPAPPRRYVVCFNPAQARRDAATRAKMVAELEKKLASGGAGKLIGNRGYRRYLSKVDARFALDRDKIAAEERYDGLWILQTNSTLSAIDVALKYKELWRVERAFRSTKSLFDTRPVFHKTDAAIRGHVFCTFLALVLQWELFQRMKARRIDAEWADIRRDLNELSETVIERDGKRFVVRSRAKGCCGEIARCVGVRLPATIRRQAVEPTQETAMVS